MDALAAAAVLNYEAFSCNELLFRGVFAGLAAFILVVEAILFRRALSRVLFLVLASACLSIPYSNFIMRPYSSYFVITRFAALAGELFVGGALLFAVSLYIIRVLRLRSNRRRSVKPIPQSAEATPVVQRPSGQASEASSRNSGAPSGPSPPSSFVSTAVRGPESQAYVRPRVTLTKSGALAAKIYAEEERKRQAFSSASLRAARAEGAERRRAAARTEAQKVVERARSTLSKALSNLRKAHRDAERAVTRRDDHVRQLGDVNPDEYDEETEKLFRDANEAEARKKDALNAVNAAQGVLRDVETWAQDQ